VDGQNAGNLEVEVPISVQCRGMLTTNLWTATKLGNGSCGEVVNFAERVDPTLTTQPRAVLVAFEG